MSLTPYTDAFNESMIKSRETSKADYRFAIVPVLSYRLNRDFTEDNSVGGGYLFESSYMPHVESRIVEEVNKLAAKSFKGVAVTVSVATPMISRLIPTNLEREYFNASMGDKSGAIILERDEYGNLTMTRVISDHNKVSSTFTGNNPR